jgi:hypothetical protein
MYRRLIILVIAVLAIGVAAPTGFALAQVSQPRGLTSKLNSYKDQGLLPDYDRWFLQRLPEASSVPRYVYHQMFVLCRERLEAKLKINKIGINERYEPSALNIYIIDPARDPMQLLNALRIKGNAVSFPKQNLIVIDECLLSRIIDADFTVSNVAGSESDFLQAELKEPVRMGEGSSAPHFQTILSLQYMNSIRGINMPAIGITENLDQEFYKMKVFTGFLMILHEIGHIYHQHKINLFSGFAPGSESQNTEIEADNFALSIFDEMDYTGIKPDIFVWMPLGLAAELSYTLRHTYGRSISDYFHDRARLHLAYAYFDIHPPISFRLLLLNSRLTEKMAPDHTNPFRVIIERTTWQRKLP